MRFNYGYLSDSNQVSSLSVGNVTITFTPDGSNASRVGGITVTGTSTGSTPYNASSIYYNQNNQINANGGADQRRWSRTTTALATPTAPARTTTPTMPTRSRRLPIMAPLLRIIL